MEILIIILLFLIIALAYSLLIAWNKIRGLVNNSKFHENQISDLKKQLKSTGYVVAENHNNISKLRSDLDRHFPPLSEEEFKKAHDGFISASQYLNKLNKDKKDI